MEAERPHTGLQHILLMECWRDLIHISWVALVAYLPQPRRQMWDCMATIPIGCSTRE